MDWRDRKYYVASFSPEAYDMRIRILKNIEGVKLNPSTNHKINAKFPDEKELRGSYHVLIGCKADIKDIVEFELRKAERNDWWAKWKEVQRDISKKSLFTDIKWDGLENGGEVILKAENKTK